MMDYKLNIEELTIALIILFHVVVLFITVVRWYFDQIGRASIKIETPKFYLASTRTKYKELDIHRWSRSIFFGSLAFSLLAVSLVFSLSVKRGKLESLAYNAGTESIFIIETKEHRLPPPPLEKVEKPIIEKKKVLPPKVIVSLAKINPVKKEIESPVYIEPASHPAPPKMEMKVKPKETAPKKEPIIEDKTYILSEEMPMFPGTEDEEFSKKKLSEYIYGKLKYPKIAVEQGIEGRAVVRFVVDTSGMVKDVKILMDPGAGIGSAAANLVKSMNDMDLRWTPGKHGGRKVKVAFTLPVSFKLKD